MAGMTKLQTVSNSDQSSSSNNYLLGDTTARVSPTTDKCVCSTDDIPVEEPSGPHLTGHKATTEDTDEEAKCVQARGVVHCTSQESRYRAGK